MRTTFAVGAFVMTCSCLVGVQSQTSAPIVIPALHALPASVADTALPGFVWRVHQVESSQPDSTARAEDQIAGLLGENVADPAAQGVAISLGTPGTSAQEPISFEIGTVINLNETGGLNSGSFANDDQMPGIPGTTGSKDNIAAEVLAWLELPVGIITMGVNSDDGFKMTIGGADPRDPTAVKEHRSRIRWLLTLR